MSKHASATPYAKALFEVALGEGRAEPVGRELEELTRVLEENADFAKFLTHPAVPTRAKRDVVDRLAGELAVAPPLRKLLALLADRDRLVLIPQLRDAYDARLMQHLRIVDAHVTTAVPLPADRTAALTRGLEQATGKRVRVTTHVNPQVLGGVVAQLGSTVYDGSLAGQLERLRAQMRAQA